MRPALSLGFCLLAIGTDQFVASSTADATPAVFSISVGYNRSDRKDLQNLKYADDDAVRNFQLMKMFEAQSVLLTELDGESRELYKRLTPVAPTLDTLVAAISAINQRIDEARKAGKRTVLYLFYSGHGDVEQGEGYVQLRGARLTRTKLISLLHASHADQNHVIIDACKSYFVVFQKGPGGKRRRVTANFLPPEAKVPSNTGFLLSASSAQDSHEWEAFQAGIFSHEVRSALRGLADLNSDGLVTYEEAAAFIFSANKSVPNRRFRPRFLARPSTRSRRRPRTTR